MSAAVTLDDNYVAERNRRIAKACQWVEDLVAIERASADMRFWIRRIRRAIARGDNITSSKWSMRGEISTAYMEALSKMLNHKQQLFTVGRTYSGSMAPLPTKDHVTVSW